MTWLEIKNRTEKHERFWLRVIVAICVIGIADEIYGHIAFNLHWPVLMVLNYDSVSMMIITVQATVATLVITILSLMTNKMDEAFMGVSDNDFLLNIKPQIFKQKTIIIAEIILVIANVFIHMAGWYNIVCTFFIIAMFLVLISVLEIYEVFLGTEKVDQEIEAYVRHESGNGGSEIQKLINFCELWKSEIAKQAENEYQRYLDVFNMLFLMAFSTDDDRKVLLDQCVELARSLFVVKNDFASCRGIDFVTNCYNQAWFYIRDHQEKVKDSKRKFYLLTEIYEDFIDAFSETDIKRIERNNFHWWIFVENIVQDALYMGPEKDDTAGSDKNENKDNGEDNDDKERKLLAIPDIHTVNDFSYYLGSLIANTLDPEAGVKIDVKKWSYPLKTIHIGATYPDELQSVANKIISECYFNFMVAQIRNGRYEVVTEWYKNLGQYANWNADSNFVYIALKLHCYIYYLAYYDDPCADTRIKDAARSFINADGRNGGISIVSNFRVFVESSAERDKNVFPEIHYSGHTLPLNIFNADLITRLRDELKRYEFMPDDFVAKQLMMDDVVLDFVTYLGGYICSTFHSADVLDAIIGEDDASAFYLRYEGKDHTDHTNDLKDFFVLMGMPDENEDIVRIETDEDNITRAHNIPSTLSKAQAIYAVLIEKIEEKYKNWSIEQAHKSPKISNAEYGKQKGVAEETLQKYFKESFKGLIDKNIEKDSADSNTIVEEYRLNLARFRVFTDTKVDMLVTGNLDQFFISFTNFLADVLWKDKKINRTDKKGLSSEQWLEYLNDQHDKIFIGSEFMLYPSEWKYRQPVNAIIKNTEHYTNGAYGLTLILDQGSIRLNFKNPRVGIRTETIDEAVGKNNAKPDASGKFRYAPSVGMEVDFSKEELQQYLKDKRKVVDVSIGVEIAITGDNIGTVIEEG